MIRDWLANWLRPALRRAEEKNQVLGSQYPDRREMFHDCDTVQLSIIHVSNATLVRMDTRSLEDQYSPKTSRPQRPNIHVVKDGETIQDVVVRMVAIAQLERS